jgi:hypothetical protein
MGIVVAVHTMKTYRGCKGVDSLILNLNTRWWSVVNLMPQSP